MTPAARTRTRRAGCVCGHRWPRVDDERRLVVVPGWWDAGAA